MREYSKYKQEAEALQEKLHLVSKKKMSKKLLKRSEPHSRNLSYTTKARNSGRSKEKQFTLWKRYTRT